MNNSFLCRFIFVYYQDTEQIVRLSLSFLLDCSCAKFRKIIYFYNVLNFMLLNFVLIDQKCICGQPVAMRTSACAASTKPPSNPVQPKPVGQTGVPRQHCATPLSTQTGSEPRSYPKCREHQQHHTRCVNYINYFLYKRAT